MESGSESNVLLLLGLWTSGDAGGGGERRSEGGFGGGARGFPDIMAAKTASTSIVAVVVSARGFFFTSLHNS